MTLTLYSSFRTSRPLNSEFRVESCGKKQSWLHCKTALLLKSPYGSELYCCGHSCVMLWRFRVKNHFHLLIAALVQNIDNSRTMTPPQNKWCLVFSHHAHHIDPHGSNAMHVFCKRSHRLVVKTLSFQYIKNSVQAFSSCQIFCKRNNNNKVSSPARVNLYIERRRGVKASVCSSLNTLVHHIIDVELHKRKKCPSKCGHHD